MKKIKFLILATVAVILSSCSDEFSISDIASVEELPAYVAFNPDGTAVTIAPFEVDENDGLLEDINVEIPTGNLSDVTVTYSLSGTAVFGTDYTIDGATASGGTLIIEHKQTTDPEDEVADNEDIPVRVLTDGVADGEKTIIITLVSASNAEGDLAIGRGGTDLLRTATVVISDVD